MPVLGQIHKEAFIQMVKLGIATVKDASLQEQIDWHAIEAFATKQGLLAIVLDGIDSLPEIKRPPKDIILQWIGEVLNAYEYRYELYCRTIAELSAFYNQHGIKMMVLKGYTCSLDWPKPGHRPSGDIDIWLFGKQKEADDALVKDKGITIDNNHHHHTVFEWSGFSVENHYDFINVYHQKSSKDIEKILKGLANDDSCYTLLYGEKIYLPTPNLNALFLIKHAASHFATTELVLRQVIDWAFFVKQNGRQVDWDWLLGVLDKYNMREFFNCVNAICVDNLGFTSDIFPYVQYDPILKDKVFNEILYSSFDREEPENFFLRIISKFKRWKSNGWKHKLCNSDSMWSAFWYGVWGHIIKPTSI